MRIVADDENLDAAIKKRNKQSMYTEFTIDVQEFTGQPADELGVAACSFFCLLEFNKREASTSAPNQDDVDQEQVQALINNI